MTTRTTPEDERARAHDAALLAAGAERFVTLPFGVARFHDGLPAHRDLNAVRVEGSPPEDVAARVAAVCAGRPHARFEVDGELAAPPGWEPDPIVHLRFTAAPPARPAGVEEVGLVTTAALREEWVRGAIPAVAETVLAGDAVIFAATPTRAFAVLEDGVAVAYALLMDDGPLQMVEDVYTTPSRRGHGLAASVVLAAVAEAYAAGAEVVHLPTEAGGPAEPLYQRLGFAPAGRTSRFTLEPQPHTN